MAKLTPVQGGTRPPSLRGRYIVDEWRGKPRLRAWPQRRPKKQSPAQKEAMAKFAEANLMAKYIDPKEMVLWNRLTSGTQLMPRDLLIQCMYGRAFTIYMLDGRVYRSMASLRDISELLDFFSSTPGTILVRGDGLWYGLEPGDNGQVLTIDEGNPVYRDSSGGGALGGFEGITFCGDKPTTSTPPTRVRGPIWTPDNTITVQGLTMWADLLDDAVTYAARIYRMSDDTASATIEALIAEKTTTFGLQQGNTALRLDFDEPAVLFGGTTYLVAYAVGSGNTVAGRGLFKADRGDNAARPNAPGAWPELSLEFDAFEPAIGTAADDTTDDIWMVWPHGFVGTG